MPKYLILITLFSLAAATRAQNATDARQKSMDSLNKISTNISLHDTSRIVAYMTMTEIASNQSSKAYYEASKDTYNFIKKTASKTASKPFAQRLKVFEAKSLTYLGYAQVNVGLIDSAHISLERAEQLAHFANNQKILSDALNFRGLAYYQQTNYLKAKEFFEEALEVRLTLKDTSAIAESYGNIGQAYRSLGDMDKNIEYLKKGLDLYLEMGDKDGIAIGYGNLGLYYSNVGDLEKSVEYYFKALKILEEKNDQSGIASLYDNLVTTYASQKDFDQALSYATKSLNIRLELGQGSKIADSYNKIGYVYFRKGVYDSAIAQFHLALPYAEAQGAKAKIGRIYNNLGANYQRLDKIELARENFEKGLRIREEMGVPNEIISSLLNLSTFNARYIKNYKEAERLAQRAMDIAKEIKSPSYQKFSAKSLHEVALLKQNWKDAYHWFKIQTTLEDSLFNAQTVKQAESEKAKHQYEKQAAADSVKAAEAAKVKDALLLAEKAENKQHKLEVKNQEQQKYFLFGGLALALLFGGFIFNRFRVTSKQKSIIEEQKTKVDEAYDELEEKNTEILDSINYAKRIQSAILPPNKVVKEYLNSSFILYKPKDIVAGDFYWMEPTKEGVLFAAADCTGHGVPGAMVSVVCNNGLNRSVREYGLTDPGKILDKTREIVISEFEKSEEEVKDGMDIALCLLEGTTLKYAGAHNPLWVIRKDSTEVEEIKAEFSAETKVERHGDYLFIEVKADKQPIGKYDEPTPYTTHTIELNEGDSFYIFSDGYADQFGGENGKKFKAANFKKLLQSIQSEPMELQKELIDGAFENWKGELEQLDDVCVIGVRV